MTSQGTAHGRFQRAISSRNLQNAEMAAREMGGLSLADALALCELLAAVDPNATNAPRCGGCNVSSMSGCRLLQRSRLRRLRSPS
jgi:hypothetical protein